VSRSALEQVDGTSQICRVSKASQEALAFNSCCQALTALLVPQHVPAVELLSKKLAFFEGLRLIGVIRGLQ